MLTPRISGGDRSPTLVPESACPHPPRGYGEVLCPWLSRFVSSFCPVSHPVLPSVSSMPDPFHRRSRALSTEHRAQLGFAACSQETGRNTDKCGETEGTQECWGHVTAAPWRGKWGQHCWFSCTPGTAACGRCSTETELFVPTPLSQKFPWLILGDAALFALYRSADGSRCRSAVTAGLLSAALGLQLGCVWAPGHGQHRCAWWLEGHWLCLLSLPLSFAPLLPKCSSSSLIFAESWLADLSLSLCLCLCLSLYVL